MSVLNDIMSPFCKENDSTLELIPLFFNCVRTRTGAEGYVDKEREGGK